MSKTAIYYFDAGNTRLKLWACAHDATVLAETSIAHEGSLPRALAQLADEFHEAPAALRGASVLDEAKTVEFSNVCVARWGLRPQLAQSLRAQAGVSNAYGADYARLGVDRWLALLGYDRQSLREGQSACVVDCGTAITVDLLQQSGMHEGGYILPGLAMMKGALLQHTARVRHDALVHQALTPGTNTAEAVEHGALLAVVSLLERLQAEGGRDLVLTGGDAARVGRALSCSYREEPLLLLKGLQRYFSEAGIS